MSAGDPSRLVAIATYDGMVRPTDDDATLVRALGDLGFEVRGVSWSDPAVFWPAFAAVIIRSCWDYHRRLPAFAAWMTALERHRVPVENDVPFLRWNVNKAYLLDLARRGVPTVETIVLESPTVDTIIGVAADRGWVSYVVKPAVSASSFATCRVDGHATEATRRIIAEAAATGAVLVQPLAPEIVFAGEWSIVFIDGRFSHAVIKRAAPGDFRVQREFGGSAVAAEPPPEAVTGAARVIDATIVSLGQAASGAGVPNAPLYARIDGFMRDGTFVIMEAELIEPDLFLRTHPPAAHAMADAFARRQAARKAERQSVQHASRVAGQI